MKNMDSRESLTKLAESYLLFLLSRDGGMLRAHLCLDFVKRRDVTQQLRLIGQLPHFKGYGISPETHLWKDYVVQDDEGEEIITPFQFDIHYKNPNNPLETECIRVTINRLVKENNEWKIASIISQDEVQILTGLIKQHNPAGQPSEADLQSFI